MSVAAMIDLRTFLADMGDSVLRTPERLSVVEEITALQHVLHERGARPVVMVEHPRMRDGSASEMAVVTNLTASRELCAAALGLGDHRNAARFFAERTTTAIDPVILDRAGAPAQEVVEQGAAADLFRLPALKQHAGDVGHYITAGHAVTVDPESGIDNMAIQRFWVREPRLMGAYPYRMSHNWINITRFWECGEPCPVAIWIGHHPAVGMGTQAKIGYPVSHWAAAGGTLGAPLRLVPSITHGERILVPADAEIVIEGFLPPGRLEAEGPFAEYSGTQGAQIANPVVEVTCITRRADAIYHDCGSGLADALVPDNMAMEGVVYAMTKPVSPALENVHVPFSGRRFHAYLQFRDPRPGEVGDALLAALAYRRLKAVVAVDEDIDIFDDREVMWAIATRLQWHRDQAVVAGLSEAYLDPSLAPDAKTMTKTALDATLPPAPRPGAPKPTAPVNRVGVAAREAAIKALGGSGAGA